MDVRGPASELEPEHSGLGQRLLAPDRRISLADLPSHWNVATIEATVAGHGALAHDLATMKHIRGALGRVLMAGASRQALAGKPCPWEPPCALDVMFREQARLGKNGIPKPWVLSLDKRRLDLVVRVTLFGFAMDWAGPVSHALADALQHHVNWRAGGESIFLPVPALERLDVKAINRVLVPNPRTTVVLDFTTPLDAAGDDPLDRPATVIGRLARRIDMLARWLDIKVDEDWPRLAEIWNRLDFETSSFSRRGPLHEFSGRARKRFQRPLVAGALGVGGDLAPIWPILVLGQACHAGRGATEGLGRYRLA